MATQNDRAGYALQAKIAEKGVEFTDYGYYSVEAVAAAIAAEHTK